ncbi:hypothetical protein [Rhodococcus sp. (in: high G+C Gram-positive bacteria)]|uniref:hypothetical protein n=1 Tax=Rhodococcus sp. TaxID=1831 RepID=UPI003B8A8590
MTARAVRLMHRGAAAVSMLLAAANLALAGLGVLPPSTALRLYLAVELPLVAVVLVVTAVRVSILRRRGTAWLQVCDELAGRIPAALMRAEVRGCGALWRWATGRTVGDGPGVTTIGYTRGTLGMPVAFAVASIVEIGAVHLLVPWAWLRWALLALSVYALVQFAGWFADRVVHPHLITCGSMTIRSGHQVVARINRDIVRQCLPRNRFQPTAAGVDGDLLALPGPDGTNIDVVLDQPVEVLLPAFLEHRRRPALISRLAIYVDEPSLARAALAPTMA